MSYIFSGIREISRFEHMPPVTEKPISLHVQRFDAIIEEIHWGINLLGGSVAGYKQRTRLMRAKIVALAVALIVAIPFMVIVGAAQIPISTVFGVILSHVPGLPIDITWHTTVDAIIWDNRLPRILASIAVGAILAVAGVVLQALVRNPLAEPYVLGLSSGAGTGAAVAVIILNLSSAFGVGICAFIGATLCTFFVLSVAGKIRSPLMLVLAGLAASFGFSSLTNFLIFSASNPETARSVNFWMLGSLAGTSWMNAIVLLIVAAIYALGIILVAPVLDALANGDSSALSVGINPGRARILLLVPTSAAVAIAVSMTGGIGFVGLIVPHAMRALIGTGHRILAVSATLAGALFLMLVDTMGRVIFAPAELPIGVITGMIGAPFILFIIFRNKKQLGIG
ncbi:iron ABC transporter permease [Actinotignum urinale]|uniref:FecCD family ABC transporter permease n=1 Tax=Actinotignum urinale TaxID=190146 RepID=UPI001C63BB36|nr:iron ABC transporter permease [Actinotignum urinale]MDY5151032.1 iron ABC transporter permease [Actinotignum urinale]WIK58657.1 iron ABC transporter permease [Actinotignum urinale]